MIGVGIDLSEQYPTKGYPTEQEENAHDFHKLQGRLLARPVLRAAGWGGQPPDREVQVSPQVSKESLTNLGMKDLEIDAWFRLADVEDGMYRLPSLYAMERHETQHEFHSIKLRLVARSSLRVIQ